MKKNATRVNPIKFVCICYHLKILSSKFESPNVIKTVAKLLLKYEDANKTNKYKVILNNLLGFGTCEVNWSLHSSWIKRKKKKHPTKRLWSTFQRYGKINWTYLKIRVKIGAKKIQLNLRLVEFIFNQEYSGLTWTHEFRWLYCIFLYKYVFENVRHTHQTNQSIQLSFPTTSAFSFICLQLSFQIDLSFVHILSKFLQFTFNQVFSKITWESITGERQIFPFHLQIV